MITKRAESETRRGRKSKIQKFRFRGSRWFPIWCQMHGGRPACNFERETSFDFSMSGDLEAAMWGLMFPRFTFPFGN